MTNQPTEDQTDALTQLTVSIVTSYLAQNKLNPDALSSLIASVHRSLETIANPQPAQSEVVEKPTTAQVRRSVTDEHLISFEDGRPYKTLKRHLSIHGLTPDEYRQKWSLPSDYPMVAPSYSARRSALAKEIGLGRKTGRKKRAR